MVAQSSITSAVTKLLDRAEQLQPSEFKQLLVSMLALYAGRKSNGLPPEESWLLTKINKEFSPAKMDRFLYLDEKRLEETLTKEELHELLSIVRQLEKYDAQKLQWVGQLALIRNVPFDVLLKQLGLYQVQNG